MKRVLITGGAGFLGFHLARYYIQNGWKVRILDIASLPKNEYSSDVEFIRGDIRSRQTVKKAVQSVQLVLHAAASLPLCSKEEIISTNVNGTRILLEESVRASISRFIYISSTAVYGVPKKHPVFESDPLVGVGNYGQSKIDAEALLSSFRSKGIVGTIIRPKTFVGTHRLGVFEILFDWIKNGKRIPILGTGDNRYQLLEVEDLVRAIYLCGIEKNTKKINTEFNVGASSFQTVAKDLTNMFKKVGSHSKILPIPATPSKLILRSLEIIGLSPLYQWVYDTADKDSFVSTKKIEQAIGWKPTYSNTQALVKAYRWYEAHFDEIKSRPTGTSHTVGWKQGALGILKKFL